MLVNVSEPIGAETSEVLRAERPGLKDPGPHEGRHAEPDGPGPEEDGKRVAFAPARAGRSDLHPRSPREVTEECKAAA